MLRIHRERSDLSSSSSSSSFPSDPYTPKSVLRASLHVRKVFTDSASRHFVQGSSETCILNFQECKLIILQKDDQYEKSEEYMLRYAEVVVHHYAKVAHSIVLRFHSKRLEITLKFDKEGEKNKWKRGFDYALELYREKMDQIVPRTLHLVSEYLLLQHDPSSLLRMVDTTPLPRVNESFQKHDINMETKYNGSIIEWRVRKLVNFEATFEALDDSYFNTPSSNGIVSEYCLLNKPPYSSTPTRASLTSSFSLTAGNSNSNSDEDADLVSISNRSSNSSDDYVMIDEIDDRAPHMHRELPPHPNDVSVSTSAPVLAQMSASSSLNRNEISFDSSFELFQPTEPTEFRPKPPHSLSSLCRVNVNIDVNIPQQSNSLQIGAHHSNVFVYNTCVNNLSLRKTLPNLLSIPMPRLNIVIMAVGTRGDIQPFILLGKALRNDGHRVRLATHECFRSLITSPNVGLEFYPLGGDPVKLSEYMVKSQGWLLPANAELIMETPAYLSMLSDVLFSTWDACTAEDPLQGMSYGDDDIYGDVNSNISSQEVLPPFKASAIISNPVTYGHIHCAEALGIPLHLMFPQPWVPTKAFPHPLSFFDTNSGWNTKNLLSYEMIDRLLWISMEQEVNRFRRDILGLQPIWMTLAQGGFNLLEVCKVPFVNMFSPLLVPKPKDWAPHIDIVGALCDVYEESNAASKLGGDVLEDVRVVDGFSPPPELVAFLEGRPASASLCDAHHGESMLINRGRPVFLGFGSMVMGEYEVHRLVKMVLRSAAMAGVRILVQSGWGNLISMETFRKYATQAAEYARKSSDSMIEENEIFPMEEETDREEEHVDDPNPSGLPSDIKDSSRAPPSKSIVGRTDKNRSSSPVWEFMFGNDSMQSHKLSGGWMADADALLLGPCPHSWLFPRVAGVVHHGGAGTTAAGLRAGKPTMICPFFGDQHFWGDRVYQAGLGPKPCPASQLTETLLAESLSMLLAEGAQKTAEETGKILRCEDGVSNAVTSFYKQLPVSDMVCEISLFMGETRLAEVYCEDCGLKMSEETCNMLHWGGRGYELYDPFQCNPCVPEQNIGNEDVYDEKFDTHCIRKLQHINWTHRRLHPQPEVCCDDKDTSDVVIKDTTFNIIHSSKRDESKQGTNSGENKSSLFTQGLDVVVEAVKGIMPTNSDEILGSMINVELDESRSYRLADYIDAEANAASTKECDEDEDKLIFPDFSPRKTRSRKETNFKYIKSLLHQDNKRVIDKGQDILCKEQGETHKIISKEVKQDVEVEPEQAPLSSKLVRRHLSVQIDRTKSEVLSREPSAEDSVRITTDEGRSEFESFEERREHILNAFYMARRVQNILIQLNRTLCGPRDNVIAGSNRSCSFGGVFGRKNSKKFHTQHVNCADSMNESSLNFPVLVDLIEAVCGDGGCESISNSKAVARRVVEVLRNKNTHTVDERGLSFLEFSLLLNLDKEGSIVWKGMKRRSVNGKHYP